MQTDKQQRIFVTGGAGFVGSNLVDRLIEKHQVVVYDNFSNSDGSNLESVKLHQNFSLIEGNILDPPKLQEAMQDCDLVVHLAANADVRFGTLNPGKDLHNNTTGTFNVLEAMRANNIKRIAFASTGSVYGDAKIIPTPEDHPFPIQTSLYGASKAAGEGLIQAYCAGYGFQAWIFRFVSMLGERYSHGHVLDFCRSLNKNPHELRVLGDGRQKKSYIYVQDSINAIFCAIDKADEQINIFNIGTNEYCEVFDSIAWITEGLKVNPKLLTTGGDRGWVGDSPFIFLDTSKIQALGWQPQYSIKEAILKTVNYLQTHDRQLSTL